MYFSVVAGWQEKFRSNLSDQAKQSKHQSTKVKISGCMSSCNGFLEYLMCNDFPKKRKENHDKKEYFNVSINEISNMPDFVLQPDQWHKIASAFISVTETLVD